MSVLIQGNVASTPWGSTLSGLAQQRATCTIELRGDDGRGPFILQFNDGGLVDAQAHVPEGDAIRIGVETGLLRQDDVPRARGAVMATKRQGSEIEIIASAVGLTSEETLAWRRAAAMYRAAMSFGVSYGSYAEIASPEPDIQIAQDIHPIIVFGALTYMPAGRMRNELARLGDTFQLDLNADLARFGFPERAVAIVNSLRSPQTIDGLVQTHRQAGAQEVLAVLYALTCSGACKGGRRSVTPGLRSPASSGVTFKSRPTPVPPLPSIPSATGTPPPAAKPAPVPAPAPVTSHSDGGAYDLNAALLDDLADTALPFEAPTPPGKPGSK